MLVVSLERSVRQCKTPVQAWLIIRMAIPKLTSYGRPSLPYVRVYQEASQDLQPGMQASIRRYMRSGIVVDFVVICDMVFC